MCIYLPGHKKHADVQRTEQRGLGVRRSRAGGPVQQHCGQQQHQQQEADDRVLSAQLPEPVQPHPAPDFMKTGPDASHLSRVPVQHRGHYGATVPKSTKGVQQQHDHNPAPYQAARGASHASIPAIKASVRRAVRAILYRLYRSPAAGKTRIVWRIGVGGRERQVPHTAAGLALIITQHLSTDCPHAVEASRPVRPRRDTLGSDVTSAAGACSLQSVTRSPSRGLK